MDFKSAFFQLPLSEEAKKLTVFNAGHRLMAFTRLVMGCKVSSGELNRALHPIFRDIENAFVIQDDLIVAGRTEKEHEEALIKVPPHADGLVPFSVTIWMSSQRRRILSTLMQTSQRPLRWMRMRTLHLSSAGLRLPLTILLQKGSMRLYQPHRL